MAPEKMPEKKNVGKKLLHIFAIVLFFVFVFAIYLTLNNTDTAKASPFNWPGSTDWNKVTYNGAVTEAAVLIQLQMPPRQAQMILVLRQIVKVGHLITILAIMGSLEPQTKTLIQLPFIMMILMEILLDVQIFQMTMCISALD